jgi:hypothetical protein
MRVYRYLYINERELQVIFALCLADMQSTPLLFCDINSCWVVTRVCIHVHCIIIQKWGRPRVTRVLSPAVFDVLQFPAQNYKTLSRNCVRTEPFLLYK